MATTFGLQRSVPVRHSNLLKENELGQLYATNIYAKLNNNSLG
jgi:hypothetical protein